MWNADQKHFDGFENGDYVRVTGTSQLYNGGMQVIAKEVRRVDESDVDESDFVTLSDVGVRKLVEQLGDVLMKMRNVHLRSLAELFLKDEEFMSKFKRAPAGIKNHHAYHGGLLEHVVSVLELASFVGNKYDRLDEDLLVMGAFLHDSGKIEELHFERDLGYRDSGQLLGHMVMGVELLQQKISQLEASTGEAFPEDLKTQLKHLILSHHGQLEFGSPVLPMTLEAIALTQIDNLDAKINSISKLIDEDANPSSPWTTYQPSLGRKIFKGLRNQS
jgi:3'-5' exoribonuclease